jgi:transcriptional regulator with XRE-family HTH domain
METINTRIRKRRAALGLSLEEMAEALKVSYQTIQHWEREPVDGRPKISTAPSRKRMTTVAEYLQVSPEWLATGKDNGKPFDPVKKQINDIYDAVPPHLQDAIAQQVNIIYNIAMGDKKGPSNPYGK